MDLDTKLADASLPIVEMRNTANQYHFVSFADADAATPHFSWEKYFAAESISGEKGFSLSQPKFFAEMDKLMADVPADQWRAYFRYHLVAQASPYLSKTFVDEDFAFTARPCMGRRNRSRAGSVCSKPSTASRQALGQMYVAKNFPPESKVRAQELVDNLRDALKARIQNVDWMGAATKAKAIEKWDSFMPKIGYPDKWRDWSGLNIGADSYVDNLRAALKFNNAWRHGQDRQAGRPHRVGHDATDSQRLLQPTAERSRVPGGDPAAAVLRCQGRRRA